MTNKEFQKKLKYFLANERGFSKGLLGIESNDELVSYENILTKIHNEHCINVVEKVFWY